MLIILNDYKYYTEETMEKLGRVIISRKCVSQGLIE